MLSSIFAQLEKEVACMCYIVRSIRWPGRNTYFPA